DQHADALVMARVVARSIIAMQADAPLGELAPEIETGADLRTVVHQATGVVSAQFDVSVTEALIRLRAYAFAANRSLTDVAQDVVQSGLRLD
ncbi:MAG: ANTAR domain-containing protein, partial [Nitrososphaerales archaeon]